MLNSQVTHRNRTTGTDAMLLSRVGQFSVNGRSRVETPSRAQYAWSMRRFGKWAGGVAGGLSVWVGGVHAELPPDAMALLATMPGRTLTVPFVIQRAIEHSDAFRALKVQVGAFDAPVLSALSPLDAQLQTTANLDWNRTQPTTPFGSTQQDTRTLTVGLSKAFRTGTAVALELRQTSYDLNFGPTFGSSVANESMASVSVTQSLWRNSFGSAVRSAIESSEKTREGLRFQWSSQFDGTVASLANAYTNAWSSQAEVRNALDNLSRRARLVDIVERRLQRGVAEKSDALAARASRDQAVIQLDEKKRILKDQWWSLIDALKLPVAWKAIDALEIPMMPWEEIALSQQRCLQTQRSYPAVVQAQFERAAAEASVEATRSQDRADFNVFGKLGGNGVLLNTSDRWGSRWGDALTLRNPLYAVGVQWTLPFDSSQQRAAVVEAQVRLMRAEVQLNQTTSQSRLRMESLCEELQSGQKALATQRKVTAQLKERADLDEQRFQRASLSVYNLIQAGDEFSAAQFQQHLFEVQLRRAAWSILQETGIGNALPEVETVKQAWLGAEAH